MESATSWVCDAVVIAGLRCPGSAGTATTSVAPWVVSAAALHPGDARSHAMASRSPDGLALCRGSPRRDHADGVRGLSSMNGIAVVAGPAPRQIDTIIKVAGTAPMETVTRAFGNTT